MSAQLTLLQALFNFAKARKELLAAAALTTGGEKKTAIVFEGEALMFLLRPDAVGVSVTPIEPGTAIGEVLNATNKVLDALATPPTEKPPRKKAEKTEPIPGPGAVPATAPATDVPKAMTVDDFRGYAQAAATKLGANGVDAVKALLDNTPIAKIDPKAYVAFKEKIDAAIASKASGLG